MFTLKVLVCNTMLLIAFCFSTNNDSSSFFWVVDRMPPSFIFGTFHVPYELIWNQIPDYVRSAFRDSDRLIVELDLNSAVTNEELSRCQILHEKQQLAQILSASTFIQLKRYLLKMKKTMESSKNQKLKQIFYHNVLKGWRRKRPIWLLCSLIYQSLLFEKNTANPVMDQFLCVLAKKARKPISSLETTHNQCDILNSMSNENVEIMLSSFLNDSANAKKYSDMIDRYKNGNSQVQKNKSITNELFWFARTDYLATKIHDDLNSRSNEILFFAVGAGHLMDDRKSAINLLRIMGHNISRVTNDSRESKISSRPMPKRWYRQAVNMRDDFDYDFNSDQMKFYLYETKIATSSNPKIIQFPFQILNVLTFTLTIYLLT